MTPNNATWPAGSAVSVRRALMLELTLLLEVVASRVITWRSVYLDYCEDVDQPDLDLEACENCPIGGSAEACPGVWRWSDTHAEVTQAERNRQR